MKKIIILILISIASICESYSQKEYFNWYFGARAGITFNTIDYSPKALTDSKMYTSEGCASISDKDGNLLLYSNGNQLWNKHHEIIEGCKDLFGCESTTQAALIIKKPKSDSIFYVFTLDCFMDPEYGLSYTVVDITGNHNSGSVIEKNVEVYYPSSEQLTAVKHANGEDYWIISHEWGTNMFRSYLLTENGLDTSNYRISKIGAKYFLKHETDYSISGYLKSAPNGKKIAAARIFSSLELFDFDNISGILSNCKSLGIDSYGLEFSPDATKLYYNQLQDLDYITQYDLVEKKYTKIPSNRINAFQLGPDGKIYCATGLEYLSVINNPNGSGLM